MSDHRDSSGAADDPEFGSIAVRFWSQRYGEFGKTVILSKMMAPAKRSWVCSGRFAMK
jgi:hypothetical protein